MKVYLLVSTESAFNDLAQNIKGIFSTLELAQAAIPGKWIEMESGYWERHSSSLNTVYIMEYEIDKCN
jgi:hypothetical protein